MTKRPILTGSPIEIGALSLRIRPPATTVPFADVSVTVKVPFPSR